MNESRAILIRGAFHHMIFDLFDFNLLSILDFVSKVFQELALCLLYTPRNTLIERIHRILIVTIASSKRMLLIERVLVHHLIVSSAIL